MRRLLPPEASHDLRIVDDELHELRGMLDEAEDMDETILTVPRIVADLRDRIDHLESERETLLSEIGAWG